VLYIIVALTAQVVWHDFMIRGVMLIANSFLLS